MFGTSPFMLQCAGSAIMLSLRIVWYLAASAKGSVRINWLRGDRGIAPGGVVRAVLSGGGFGARRGCGCTGVCDIHSAMNYLLIHAAMNL